MFANSLHEIGIVVTALDKQPPIDLNSAIPFTHIRFEDFTPNQTFDLVHCRNVLPFMDNKLEQLARMMTMGMYVFFTFFGPNDDWKENTLKKEDVAEIIKDQEILYFSEEEYNGTSKAGSMKHWHIFTYFVKVKSN